MKPERLEQFRALRSARLVGRVTVDELVRDRETLIEMVEELVEDRIRRADATHPPGKPMLTEVPGAEVTKG